MIPIDTNTVLFLKKKQEWLYNCANGIVKYKNMPVKWVTPLGLPVVQPYFQKRFAKIKETSDVSTDEWMDPAQFRCVLCQVTVF